MRSRRDAEARRGLGHGFSPRLRVSACLLLVGLGACTLQPAPVIIWSDEFDGPAGLTFDRTKWVADTGGAGWGNKELQFYTTRAENVALDGDGHLVITARAADTAATDTCWYGRCRYTSARLKTK